MHNRVLELVLSLSLMLVHPAVSTGAEIIVEGLEGHPADYPGSAWVRISGLEPGESVRSVEFSLETDPMVGFSGISAWPLGLVDYQEPDVVVTFSQCLEPGEALQVAELDYWYSYPDNRRESAPLCAGPTSSSHVDPPAPAYQTCDGTWKPLALGQGPGGESPGCATVYTNVALATGTWGVLKTRF